MGLYIAKHFVEVRGGKISIAGNEKNGLEFRFTIPIRKEAVPDVLPETPTAA